MNPVMFGERIKIEGERASSAVGKLAEEKKSAGETVEMPPPTITNGDLLVLTGDDAEAYAAITDRDRKRAIPMLFTHAPAEILSTILRRHKKNEETARLGFLMRLMKRVSDDLMSPELTALFENPRVVQDTDVLDDAEPALTLAEFDRQIAESDVPVLVDFWAPWCRPCRAMDPVIEEVEQEYAGRLKVIKVNYDESPEILQRYNVIGVPQFIVFNNGQPGQPIEGAKPPQKFKEELEKRLADAP